MATITLKLGDSFEVIPTLQAGSVICDPPYLISFMDKNWDDTEGENVDWFAEWLGHCFAVLPSGGVVKVFSATRTFHRLAQAMERVGFAGIGLEAWVYGSGFPKSLNVSKAIDKHLGKASERKVLGNYRTPEGGAELSTYNNWQGEHIAEGTQGRRVPVVSTAATPEARRFEGWGTALKPAWEPFIVGVKP